MPKISLQQGEEPAKLAVKFWNAPDDSIWTAHELAAALGRRPSSLYQDIKDGLLTPCGTVPKPHTQGVLVFRKSDAVKLFNMFTRYGSCRRRVAA